MFLISERADVKIGILGDFLFISDSFASLVFTQRITPDIIQHLRKYIQTKMKANLVGIASKFSQVNEFERAFDCQ
jgi:hypothetical protein